MINLDIIAYGPANIEKDVMDILNNMCNNEQICIDMTFDLKYQIKTYIELSSTIKQYSNYKYVYISIGYDSEFLGKRYHEYLNDDIGINIHDTGSKKRTKLYKCVDEKEEDIIYHAGVLIVNNVNSTITRFEPHGLVSSNIALDSVLRMINNYKYISPDDYQDIVGPQSLECVIRLKKGNKSMDRGLCFLWSAYFMQINIINSHNTVDWNYSNMYDTIRPAYPYDPKAFVLIHEYATHIYSRIRNIKLRAARCISSSDFYNKFEDIIRKMNI